ncbi:hypothetical protein ACFOUP_02195 [Belliella kenyensis]|uniref:Glycosyl hydrolases family 43 n=1 Tax=Belliella kenyensis TaxID=1472724 RepID=A0ABV8EFY7_9BACT|nr:hypothetical protein [Belliella kenyensis]MCH7400993.1 hypothetical protein [Belliella kenyensis]MDN3603991.1 hypothetical protein [Belliella kenyensis]
MKNTQKLAVICILLFMSINKGFAQDLKKEFYPGQSWTDTNGNVINAHGGGILYENETYYWFGESRAERASLGVAVYSSKDLSIFD